MNNLLSIAELSKARVSALLTRAQAIYDAGQHLKPSLQSLQQKTIANLFFEPSTRTRASFTLAAQRLGATVLDLDVNTSSLCKGEQLIDMLLTLEAMSIDAFVIRHKENHLLEEMQQQLPDRFVLINAGAGQSSHPSQALLDLLTIKQAKKEFEKLTVTVIGDVRHSRVATALLQALQLVGVGTIRVVAPAVLQSEQGWSGVHYSEDLEASLAGTDVIYCLRLQRERFQKDLRFNEAQYVEHFGLRQAHLKLAKEDTIIMHPGPVNRDVELAASLIDSPQSRILQQVQNGVAMRMAILEEVLS